MYSLIYGCHALTVSDFGQVGYPLIQGLLSIVGAVPCAFPGELIIKGLAILPDSAIISTGVAEEREHGAYITFNLS